MANGFVQKNKEYANHKRLWSILFWVMAVLGGAGMVCKLIPYILLWKLQGQVSSEAASVGIIGGADGPTAVFVTSSPNAGWLPAVLLICGLCGLVILRYRSKK